MKITSIQKRLEKLGVEVKIDVTARHSHMAGNFTGYNIKLTASDGRYDVEATTYVDLNELNEDQQALDVATTDYYCIKPSHDESDPMTDYCAWSFWHSIKMLDNKFAKVEA